MFGMVKDEEPDKNAFMASFSAAIKSQNSINSNSVTLIANSGASDHSFDDAIIRDL